MPALSTVSIDEGTIYFRGYHATWGHDEHNPGYGDARFSPIDDPVDGFRLPSLYLGETEVAALLETVFHELHHLAARTIYESDLVGVMLAHIRLPRSITVIDIRDEALTAAGLERDQIVSTSAEHYPCTRRAAIELLSQHPNAQGFVWHSRQAELLEKAHVQAIVLYGNRFPSTRGLWPLVSPGVRNLFEGPGRLLVDELAESLHATVERST